MTNFGADAVNELFWTNLDVTTTPQNLPGMVPVNRGPQGYVSVRPDNSTPWNPGHVRIVVESGTCRVRCDGVDPDAGMGQLYGTGTPNGPVIDYTDVLRDYQGVLHRFRVVREVAGTAAKLSITYYN